MKDNPSVRREGRYEPASVIPLKQEVTLIDWLAANKRLIPREKVEIPNTQEDEEIEELIEVDDSMNYDDFEDLGESED